jgi:hypothetical protein
VLYTWAVANVQNTPTHTAGYQLVQLLVIRSHGYGPQGRNPRLLEA